MKILTCVAGMPYAEQTVKFAYMIARLYDASISLLTVVADESDVPKAKTVLAGLSQQTDVKVVDQIVRLGKTAVSEIISECHRGGYDLVVLGTRVISGFSLFKRSAVARTITEKVPVPVLVVKQAPPALRRILICTSGHAGELTIVQTGLELALLAGATVGLLYVADPMPHMYSGLEEMEETAEELLNSGTPIAIQLKRAVDLARESAVESRFFLRHGLVIDEIVNEIARGSYDLVVIGATEHEAFWQALVLGNVSPHVVENSPASVMVVHHS